MYNYRIKILNYINSSFAIILDYSGDYDITTIYRFKTIIRSPTKCSITKQKGII